MEGLLSKSFITDLKLDGERNVSAVKTFSVYQRGIYLLDANGEA
jgi:hypothetical protein